MARVIKKDNTSQSIRFDIFDPTTGERKTGITSSEAGIAFYYKKGGMAASETAITLSDLAAHTSAYSSGGIKEWRLSYRLDIPNAALDTAGKLEVVGTDTAGNVYVFEDILVSLYDPDAARSDSNVTYWNGNAVATPNTNGVPKVDVTHILGTAGATTELSAIPSATASFWDRISFLFMRGRNKMTQTSSTTTLYKDDGTTSVGTSTVSDDGTTFTRGKAS